MGTLRSERGDALIEGLMMFGLVLLVVLVAAQALVYAHARSVALAAAQDGANTAATNGVGAGIARASSILQAAGGTGRDLNPTATAGQESVTVDVAGHAPRIFPLSLFLPRVSASATLPLEGYPTGEARP